MKTEMLLHSLLSWTLVHNAVAPLTALVLLTAATVPGPPAPRPAVDPVLDLVPDPVVDPVVGDPTAALEATAVELAHELRAVPADDTDRLCARGNLRTRWTEPTGFDHGAHVGTIGPAPDHDTIAVNGVVVCGASTWAYMGFEARRVDAAWQVTAVPYLEESHGDVASLNLDADPDPHGVDDHEVVHADSDAHTHEAARGGERAADATPARAPAPSPSAPTARVAQSAWLAGLGPIEPYAAYEPQRSCSPTVKAGTGVLRDTLLGTHPQTRNLGVVRACHIGGRSEHKEGRAFDWGAYVDRPVERAAVERFLTQLFATDADGNTHALARRLGVMYVVWDGQIWASHRAQEGWRHYQGPNPHVDHVHISLSWAGGLGQTSFFTQDLAGRGVLGLVPPGATPLATDATPVATVPVADQGLAAPSTGAVATSPPTPTGDGGRSPAPISDATEHIRREDETPQRRLDEHQRREQERARQQQRRAEEQQRRQEEQQRREEEQQRRAEEQQRRAEEQQRRAEEKRRREEARQAEQQAVTPPQDGPGRHIPDKGNGKGGGPGRR